MFTKNRRPRGRPNFQTATAARYAPGSPSDARFNRIVRFQITTGIDKTTPPLPRSTAFSCYAFVRVGFSSSTFRYPRLWSACGYRYFFLSLTFSLLPDPTLPETHPYPSRIGFRLCRRRNSRRRVSVAGDHGTGPETREIPFAGGKEISVGRKTRGCGQRAEVSCRVFSPVCVVVHG